MRRWLGRAGTSEACRILCDTAARLHAPRSGPLPDLHPLEDWFQPLFQLAPDHAALAPAADTARQLLAAPHAIGPLHGDLHHENVLDFGERGWLAIDPHGLSANEHSTMPTSSRTPTSAIRLAAATLPGRLEARLDTVVAVTGLQPERLLRWIVAWTGLWQLGSLATATSRALLSTLPSTQKLAACSISLGVRCSRADCRAGAGSHPISLSEPGVDVDDVDRRVTDEAGAGGEGLPPPRSLHGPRRKRRM